VWWWRFCFLQLRLATEEKRRADDLGARQARLVDFKAKAEASIDGDGRAYFMEKHAKAKAAIDELMKVPPRGPVKTSSCEVDCRSVDCRQLPRLCARYVECNAVVVQGVSRAAFQRSISGDLSRGEVGRSLLAGANVLLKTNGNLKDNSLER
jgi:hypothetical protein